MLLVRARLATLYTYYLGPLSLTIGPASAPTALSVVWDPPSAVVSFQSPVYGGECVDYYVVTAVSEEENATCEPAGDLKFNCNLSDRNVNDFNFTVYSVTRGVDGVLQNGQSSTDCSKDYVLSVQSHINFHELLF